MSPFAPPGNLLYLIVAGAPNKVYVFLDILVTAPALIAPPEGVNTATAVKLSWQAISSPLPLTYRYQVAFDRDFSNMVANSTTPATNVVVTGLVPNFSYYWRVYVDTGGPLMSRYSTVRSFNALATLPPVVHTGAATDISANTANLNGSLTMKGTSGFVNVGFEYGLTTSSRR
jgi:hypothetical protein